MSEYRFPFPGRDLADKELTYDPCYSKIPEKDRAVIVDKAWKRGEKAAEMVFNQEKGQADFYTIARTNGLTVVEKNIDYVVGNQRYFSDYLSGKDTITLYSLSVRKWAESNGLHYEQAVNLILSHEFYHFLEVKRIGLASREYQVPMLILGPLKLGQTGVRALSEVGAHAFARRYHELLKEASQDA